MTTNIARKSTGFVVALLVVGLVGWLIAWNQEALAEFVASVGGIGNVVLAAVGLAALVLSVFWPQRWHIWIHRVLIAGVIITLLLGGGEVFGSAFEQAPWLTVLGLAGFILVTAALYSVTVLEHPVQAWRRLFQRRGQQD